MMKHSHQNIIDILNREKCSCVIESENGEIYIGYDRGVTDLLSLLNNNQTILHGAFIADKVVGKGAAAIMILGSVGGIYADVISRQALQLIENAGIDLEYRILTDNIINRAGTDICPIEKLCADCKTAQECLPHITDFVAKIK